MNILKRICRVVDTVIDGISRVISFLVLAVVAIIMCEVILRRIFGLPQIWTTDLITMLFGCYTVMILAFGLQHNTFVCVDLIVERMKSITRHWIALITAILFQLPFAYFLIPRSWTFFYRSLSTGERGYSVWAPPIWPVKLCLFIGMVLLGIQILNELLKQILWLLTYYKSGKQEPAPIYSMSYFTEKHGD